MRRLDLSQSLLAWTRVQEYQELSGRDEIDLLRRWTAIADILPHRSDFAFIIGEAVALPGRVRHVAVEKLEPPASDDVLHVYATVSDDGNVQYGIASPSSGPNKHQVRVLDGFDVERDEIMGLVLTSRHRLSASVADLWVVSRSSDGAGEEYRAFHAIAGLTEPAANDVPGSAHRAFLRTVSDGSHGVLDGSGWTSDILKYRPGWIADVPCSLSPDYNLSPFDTKVDASTGALCTALAPHQPVARGMEGGRIEVGSAHGALDESCRTIAWGPATDAGRYLLCCADDRTLHLYVHQRSGGLQHVASQSVPDVITGLTWIDDHHVLFADSMDRLGLFRIELESSHQLTDHLRALCHETRDPSPFTEQLETLAKVFESIRGQNPQVSNSWPILNAVQQIAAATLLDALEADTELSEPGPAWSSIWNTAGLPERVADALEPLLDRLERFPAAISKWITPIYNEPRMKLQDIVDHRVRELGEVSDDPVYRKLLEHARHSRIDAWRERVHETEPNPDRLLRRVELGLERIHNPFLYADSVVIQSTRHVLGGAKFVRCDGQLYALVGKGPSLVLYPVAADGRIDLEAVRINDLESDIHALTVTTLGARPLVSLALAARPGEAGPRIVWGSLSTGGFTASGQAQVSAKCTALSFHVRGGAPVILAGVRAHPSSLLLELLLDDTLALRHRSEHTFPAAHLRCLAAQPTTGGWDIVGAPYYGNVVLCENFGGPGSSQTRHSFTLDQRTLSTVLVRTADDLVIYGAGRSGLIWCLRRPAGGGASSVSWTYGLRSPVCRIQYICASPSGAADVAGTDRLVVGSVKGEVVVLDARDGTRLWKYKSPTIVTDLAVGQFDDGGHVLLLVAPDRLTTLITTDAAEAKRVVASDLERLSSVGDLAAIRRKPKLATLLNDLYRHDDLDKWIEAFRGQQNRAIRSSLLRVLLDRQIERKWNLLDSDDAANKFVLALTARELKLLACHAGAALPVTLLSAAWERVDALITDARKHGRRGDDGKHAATVAALMLLRVWATRPGSMDGILAHLQKLEYGVWEWGWISLDVARILVERLRTRTESRDALVYWFFDHITDLPGDIVVRLHCMFDTEEAARYGLLALTRIIQAVYERQEPDRESLDQLAAAMTALGGRGVPKLLTAVIALETQRRDLSLPRHGLATGPAAPSDALVLLQEVGAAVTSWQPRTPEARLLSSAIKSLIRPDSRPLVQGTPLHVREDEIHQALARVARAKVRLHDKYEEHLEPSPWMKRCYRLALRALSNVRLLLGAERRRLLQTVRARVAEGRRSVKPDGSVEIELRLHPEGSRTLTDVTVHVSADGRGGLRPPGVSEHRRSFSEYPASHAEFDVKLDGFLEPGQGEIDLTVTLIAGAYKTRESWSVKAPSPPPRSTKIPMTESMEKRLAELCEHPGVTVFTHPRHWSNRIFVDHYKDRHGASDFNLDEIFANYGRRRRYEASGLTQRSLWERCFGNVDRGGSEPLLFHADAFWVRLPRESRGLPRQLMVALEAARSERPIILMGPHENLFPFVRQTEGSERLFLVHRLPGWAGESELDASTKDEWIDWFSGAHTETQRRIALQATGWDIGRLTAQQDRWTKEPLPQHWGEWRSALEADFRQLDPLVLALALAGCLVSKRRVDRIAEGDYLDQRAMHMGKALAEPGRLNARSLARIQRASDDKQSHSRGERKPLPTELAVQGIGQDLRSIASNLAPVLSQILAASKDRALRLLKDLGIIDLTKGGLRTRAPWRSFVAQHHDLGKLLEALISLSSAERICTEFLDISKSGKMLYPAVLKVLLPDFEAPDVLPELAIVWKQPGDSADSSQWREKVQQVLSLTLASLPSHPHLVVCHGLESPSPIPLVYIIINADNKVGASQIESDYAQIEEHWNWCWSAHTGRDGQAAPSKPTVLVLGPGALRLPRDPRRRWAVISPKDIVAALPASKTAWQAVMRVTRSQLPMTHMSPYQIGGPLPPNSPLFVGRQFELDYVRQNIRKQSILLVGERQIGKTSLLNRVHADLQGKSDVFPIWLDLQNAKTVADVVSLLTTGEFVDKLGTRLPADCAAPFARLADHIAQTHPGRLPIFLINEIDKLAHHTPAAIGEMRSLNESRKARFLAVGYTSIFKTLELDSTFFHFFSGPDWKNKALYLSSLSEGAARDLLRLLEKPPLSLRWRSDAERDQGEALLISLAYRIPWVVQLHGEAMVKRMDAEQRTVIELEDAKSVAFEHQGVVWSYLNHISFDVPDLDVKALQSGIWLMLACVARRLYFSRPRPIIHDLQLDKRGIDDSVTFTSDTAGEIMLQTTKGLLNEGEYEMVDNWVSSVPLNKILMHLSLSPIIVPVESGQVDSFAFPLHLYPRELFRLRGGTDPWLDDYILEQTLKFLNS